MRTRPLKCCESLDRLDVETVGEDQQLLARILPASRHHAIAMLARPRSGSPESMRMPVHFATHSGAARRNSRDAVGIGQNDAQIAVVVLLPVGQHLVGRLGQRAVVVGERRIDHRQLVRVGADRLDLAPHRDQAIRGAEECGAKAFDHRLHAPVLPQEAMAAARAEVGDAETRRAVSSAAICSHTRVIARA